MSRSKVVFAIGVVAALTVPVVWFVVHRRTGEPLTAERLAAARALWEKNGPGSYMLDVDVSGVRHHVEVKDGVAVSMTTNGKEVDERLRQYWTVEGMFKSLSEELSNLRRPDAAFGVSDPDDVVLRAAFDATYGYPAQFLRHVLGQNRSVEWRTRLTPR